MARISGWMTIAVGAVHVAFTTRDFDHPSLAALWFGGSGLAVMLIGALTLLAGAASAVRWTAVAANLAGLLLAVGFGVLTGFSGPQGLLLIALVPHGGGRGRDVPDEAEGLNLPLPQRARSQSDAPPHPIQPADAFCGARAEV